MAPQPLILAIFLVFAVAEATRGGFFRKAKATRRDAIVELFSTSTLLLLTQPAILIVADLALSTVVPGARDALIAIPILAQLALLLVFDDMAQYWWHRAAHTIPGLYNLHRAHHDAEYLSVRVVWRNNFFFYAMMPSIWFSGALIYLGLGWVYAPYIVVKHLVIIGAHSEVHWDEPLYRIKWLSPLMWLVERTISTPATHSAHHGKYREDGVTHYKGNFGNLLFFWDVLFGTAKITRRFPNEYGVEDLQEASWQEQLLWPLVRASSPSPKTLEAKMTSPQTILVATLALSAGLAPTTAVAQLGAPIDEPTLREPSMPGVTEWKPEGPRDTQYVDPVIGRDRAVWNERHGNALNSDELTTVIAPTFELQCITDPTHHFPVAGAQDTDGFYYASPAWAGDRSVVAKYDMRNCSTVWSITGEPGVFLSVADAPMTLTDPDSGEEWVVAGKRHRVWMLRKDGTEVWSKPTRLGVPPETANFDNLGQHVAWGPNYLPGVDGIVMITGDGFIEILDRKTGEPLIEEPYKMAGSPAPGMGIDNPSLDPFIEEADELFAPLIAGAPEGASFNLFVAFILGQAVVNANTFSRGPLPDGGGRIYISTTAPDDEDGEQDGLSENGAVYTLDVVKEPGAEFYEVKEVCHLSFEGGSATTTAGKADETRFYVADSSDNLLAYDPATCEEIWSLPVGGQIVASPTVASDNNEIYVNTLFDTLAIIDRGDEAEVKYSVGFDLWEGDETDERVVEGTLLSSPIGANHLAFQVGVGTTLPIGSGSALFPLQTAIAIADRETGDLLWFSESFEDSTALVNVLNDGTLVIPQSPTRTLVSRTFRNREGLSISERPVQGGIAVWRSSRKDLVVRDAACAGASRDERAATIDQDDLVGATEDVASVEDLITQARNAAVEAIADGDLSEDTWSLVDALFEDAESLHDQWRSEEGSAEASALLTDASAQLEAACKCVDATLPQDESSAACGAGASSSSGGCSVGPLHATTAAPWFALILGALAMRHFRRHA
jgi:sterol desaturase/sphingolipid hydroxylase (fatty acid hydroxylase superfamily)/outer membrane protein assembly factor BamB